MPSMADYHSVSNVETESTPDLEHETTAQQPRDDEFDSNSDSECRQNSNVEGRTATADHKDGGHAQGFHLSPGFIDEGSWGIKLLSWTWEVFLTVLPIFFICMVLWTPFWLRLVRSSSEYGVRLEEITRLGPTIYPILFAMVVARFYRNVARWYLERPGGITVSSLEQIVGSQSFASALERLIIVRARLLLGVLILFSWAMSPLGGQSLLRLLHIDGKVSTHYRSVFYDNRAHQHFIYFDMDWYDVQAADIVPALYSASLLSPRKQQQASMDLWGRPKIPQWPLDPTQDAEGTWLEIDNNALESGRDYYTSLIGINMQGLNLSGDSTQYEFDLDSNYISLNCSMVTDGASRKDLGKITFPGGNLSDVFWGKNYTWADRRPSFEPKLALSADVDQIPPLQKAAIYETAYLLYTSRGNPEDLYVCSVFNCTTATINLRTSFRCTAQGCTPQRQRQIRDIPPMEADEHYRRFTALENAMGQWSHLTQVVVASSSATDNYIANDENVYANQKAQIWKDIDINMFSRRLTAAFNTVWEAGMDSYNLTKSSLAMPEDPTTFWTDQTRATITTTEPAYYVNRSWAVILILTTTFLQILAVCGLVLKCLIRGPDILGFASSLTRDNHHVPVSGGSFQGGAERARSLSNMRVQLADVHPSDSRGYIALSAVPSTVPAAEGSDGEKEESRVLGRLEKKRMYM